MAQESPAARRPSKAEAEPRHRDAEQTRRAILDAAVLEFARLGMGGARVDEIGRRAGCNLRMIYYYFGSKEALYVAALEKVYADFVAAERALNLDSLSPIEGVQRLISFTWHYFREHPEFISLLNTENMHGAKFARQSAEVSGGAGAQMRLIEDVLRRGVREGVFRADVAVFETHVTIVSLCYFYLSNRATMSNYLGRDMTSQGACDAWLTHMSQVVLASLVRR
jgi:AcrR family transcriptional regulator